MKQTKAREEFRVAALAQLPFLTDQRVLDLHRAFLQAHGLPRTSLSILSGDRDGQIEKHRAGRRAE